MIDKSKSGGGVDQEKSTARTETPASEQIPPYTETQQFREEVIEHLALASSSLVDEPHPEPK